MKGSSIWVWRALSSHQSLGSCADQDTSIHKWPIQDIVSLARSLVSVHPKLPVWAKTLRTRRIKTCHEPQSKPQKNLCFWLALINIYANWHARPQIFC
jgi:hypothetical protein